MEGLSEGTIEKSVDSITSLSDSNLIPARCFFKIGEQVIVTMCERGKNEKLKQSS
jgi:hypothetical protein